MKTNQGLVDNCHMACYTCNMATHQEKIDQAASETIQHVHVPESQIDWAYGSSDSIVDNIVIAVRNFAGESVDSSDSSEDYLEVVKRATVDGIPSTSFDYLRVLLNVPLDDLCSLTHMSKRTVARRRKENISFKNEEAERIIHTAATFQRALGLFEDLNKARWWFKESLPGLGGETPLKMCSTYTGMREVDSLIGRIQHGVF